MKVRIDTPSLKLWFKTDPDNPLEADVQLKDPHEMGASDADDYVERMFCPEPKTFAIFLGSEATNMHLANVIRGVNEGGTQMLLVCSRDPRFQEVINRTEEMSFVEFEDLPAPDIVIVDTVYSFALGGASDEQILEGIGRWAQGEFGPLQDDSTSDESA